MLASNLMRQAGIAEKEVVKTSSNRQSKSVLTRMLAYSGALALLAQGSSCSTTETKPEPAPTISPPMYVQVPHPLGFDLGDLQALFAAQGAPKLESLGDCDAEYRKLEKATKHPDELRKGARELVRNDPVNYHWCFYSKFLGLENALRNTQFIEDRQKVLLETYSFLTPIARGYMVEFKDSRYLRWAVRHYRGVSEWVFYRKLDQSEQMTQLLVEVTNPFGLWRDTSGERSVLEKYNLAKPKDGKKAPVERRTIFPKEEEVASPLEAPVSAGAKDAVTGERLPAQIPPPPPPAAPAPPAPVTSSSNESEMIPDMGTMKPETVSPTAPN